MNYKLLQKTLAENKVFDAWQYVESLTETMGYMNMSADLVKNIYAQRVSVIEKTTQELFQLARIDGRAAITEETLRVTNLTIAGKDVSDTIFLKKTTLEFFHYARMSMDILFQIINASLLGDSAIAVEDKSIIGKLLRAMDQTPEFSTLKFLLESNKNTNEYNYLQAFDNHVKHIKTILLQIKNSILFGNDNTFQIDEFSYMGNYYSVCDAIPKITDIQQYVESTVDVILAELQSRIQYCIDNQNRVQSLHFKMQIQEVSNKSNIEHVTFFIYVDNDLSDLPQEIAVLPLIVKPNDDIYSFDFRFEEIFIKRTSDEKILGVAKLKNGLESREFYRKFSVVSCDEREYANYLYKFKNKYRKISMNFAALEGEIISYKVDQ